MRRITTFDTTLRDGEQAPGNAMSPKQKLNIALLLEKLGVDRIEVGFPASSPSDFEAAQLISQHLTTAQFATLSRAVREDVETAVRAGGTERHEIQVLVSGSDLHLEHKRGISRREGIREVVDAVAYARSLGVESIALAIEDASRGEHDLLRAYTEGAVEAGATRLVPADTCGYSTPDQYADVIAAFREWAPPSVGVSTHCHNDFGLSLANAVSGLQAGADEAQVTLGGIGERAGNTPLEELAALLLYKKDHYGFYTTITTEDMYAAYSALRDVIRLPEPRTKAVFGTYAFGTAAGIHQQGVLRNPATYEYVEPTRFGRERSLLIGRHSGRAVLRHLLGELGVEVDDAELAELYRVHIAERVNADCEGLDVLKERLGMAFAERDGAAARA
ncbi:LeuA family protein [Streptomyces sp. KMM 9044]|uniref:LeuA family protein n=1 Tax=Streptomyces sp. KMM 9044 TaxID=2744474 RepID=UPI002150C9CA|nr:pyruvate carboxyltransferase [Streptomyces sp. KMM 9044]WAX82094.1 pyruvate carboxyltransferase [Streptomyces sp. KMM 9044]